MKLSKSKLALAKVINDNDGWPDEGNYVVQQDDFGLYASIGKPTWMKRSKRFSIEYCAFICDAKKITNRHQTVLSREEYYQVYSEATKQDAICLAEAINLIDGGDNPKADADGWIEWKGGECPVDGRSLVNYKMRDGGACEDGEEASDLVWEHRLGGSDIIAYRLHKPEVKPEFCESVMRSIQDPESKPTIEQLAQDYRNKIDYANRKLKEAEDASASASSALSLLRDACKKLGLNVSPSLDMLNE